MFALAHYNLIWIVVAMALIVTAVNNNVSDDYTCHRETSTLTCDYDLPDHWNIQDGITEVYITDYKFSNISQRKHIFKHAKWSVITTLDIVTNRKYDTDFTLNDYDFVDLPHLQRFGIHSEYFLHTGFYAFVGLYNLLYLNFSGCKRLRSSHIIERLSNKNINFSLNYLNLDNVNSKRDVKFDDVFFNMLYDRKVLHLSIRATSISFIRNNGFNNSLQLVSLDISYSVIATVSYKQTQLFNSTNVFRNLKQINASGIIVGQFYLRTINGYSCGHNVLSVDTIDFSNLNNAPLYITQVVDLRCYWRLRHLYLHSNAIVTFNSTVYYPPFIEILDLSWNGMELISTTALDGLGILKSLNLSNNRLYKMEHNHEFKYLFMKLYALEMITLQNNSFTVLPKRLFQYINNLKILILSNNQLESIDFNIDHLHKLRLIDLQRNNIVYLEPFRIQKLDNHLKLRNGNIDTPIVFNIMNNKFVCNCEHIQFVEWLSKELQPMFNETYTCSLENNMVNIDSITLQRTLYLCYRISVIVGSTVSSCVIIIVSGLTMLFCFRRRHKKQRKTIINRFLDQQMKGQCDEKYLVFISFSSYDFLIINNYVEPALKYHLWNQYKIPERLIVTGDSTIRPGFPLLTEIMRCTRAACVMVCLVSQSYCDSKWCQTEVREAVEQGKPIILLFLEEIKQQNMPDSIWMLFNRNTMSKLVQINGKYEPLAGWDNFCESIVTLASNKYSIDITERKRKEKQSEYIKFEEDEVLI